MSKKGQVVGSARELFEKYGYKISMDQIAKESGVTKKTIYSYFKDKDELIQYFLYDELSIIENKMNEIDLKDDSFCNKLSEMIIFILDYKGNSRLLNSIENEYKYSSECMEIFNKTIIDFIKKRLIMAIDMGYIKDCDVDITAFIIYKVLCAIKFEWKGNIDTEKFTRHLTDIIVNGALK